MIINLTNSARGVQILLTRPEASQLAIMLAMGRPGESAQALLRLSIMQEIARLGCVAGGEEFYKKLPSSLENALAAPRPMAIVALIEQAMANQLAKPYALKILQEMAARLQRLLEQAGPGVSSMPPKSKGG